MDPKDEQILQILRENAKLKTSEISNRTGIPATTIHNRIKKLTKDGVIKKYTIMLDYAKLGRKINAIVLISLNLKSMKEENVSVKDILLKLKQIPEVTWAAIVTGSSDVIIRVRAEDVPALDHVLTDRLMDMGWIGNTETMIVTHDVTN